MAIVGKAELEKVVSRLIYDVGQVERLKRSCQGYCGADGIFLAALLTTLLLHILRTVLWNNILVILQQTGLKTKISILPPPVLKAS